VIEIARNHRPEFGQVHGSWTRQSKKDAMVTRRFVPLPIWRKARLEAVWITELPRLPRGAFVRESGQEFTTIFWETYHGIRTSDPDGDVPVWRRHAYKTALDHCIKARLVDEIGASLVYFYQREFDELFRGFQFLLKHGKAGPIPRLFWNQVRQRIAHYYSALALAEKLRQSPMQSIPEFLTFRTPISRFKFPMFCKPPVLMVFLPITIR